MKHFQVKLLQNFDLFKKKIWTTLRNVLKIDKSFAFWSFPVWSSMLTFSLIVPKKTSDFPANLVTLSLWFITQKIIIKSPGLMTCTRNNSESQDLAASDTF